jgi:hypothetical protein
MAPSALPLPTSASAGFRRLQVRFVDSRGKQLGAAIDDRVPRDAAGAQLWLFTPPSFQLAAAEVSGDLTDVRADALPFHRGFYVTVYRLGDRWAAGPVKEWGGA